MEDKRAILWKPFNEPPLETMKVVVITDCGNISNGIYDAEEEAYKIRDGLLPKFWMPYVQELEHQVMFKDSDYQIIMFSDLETEEPVSTLGGFGLSVKYNFENIKDVEKMVQIADSMGQFFFEDMVNITQQK